MFFLLNIVCFKFGWRPSCCCPVIFFPCFSSFIIEVGFCPPTFRHSWVVSSLCPHLRSLPSSMDFCFSCRICLPNFHLRKYTNLSLAIIYQANKVSCLLGYTFPKPQMKYWWIINKWTWCLVLCKGSDILIQT